MFKLYSLRAIISSVPELVCWFSCCASVYYVFFFGLSRSIFLAIGYYYSCGYCHAKPFAHFISEYATEYIIPLVLINGFNIHFQTRTMCVCSVLC